MYLISVANLVAYWQKFKRLRALSISLWEHCINSCALKFTLRWPLSYSPPGIKPNGHDATYGLERNTIKSWGLGKTKTKLLNLSHECVRRQDGKFCHIPWYKLYILRTAIVYLDCMLYSLYSFSLSWLYVIFFVQYAMIMKAWWGRRDKCLNTCNKWLCPPPLVM